MVQNLAIKNGLSDCLSILIIEDNEEYFYFLKKSLIHTSKDPLYIKNSRTLTKAVELLTENKFDVVLLDLFLLDSKGHSTFTELSQYVKNLPIILLTGINNEDLANKILKEGAQDYFVKDEVTPHLILNSINHSVIRKKMETDLHRLQGIKDKFIANAVHEIRTPVSVIKACFDNIEKRGMDNLTEDQKKFVEVAGKNAERLSILSQHLLSLNNLEGECVDLEFSHFDLIRLIEDYKNSIEISELYPNIKINFSYDSSLELVYGDKDTLYQVINNILSNCLRYAKSRIEIKVSQKTEEEKKNVLIEINDDGPGIDSQIKEKIFDRLFKHNHEKMAYHGSGLGLYISKLIIEKHGGKIWGDNSPSGGARFYVEFPLVGENNQNTDKTNPETKNKILIVEDDTNVMSLLKKRLQSDGFEIHTASHVEAALKLLSDVDFNLILLDLRLKKIDGTALLQRIKFGVDEKNKDVPIIILSGMRDKEVVEYVLDIGASSYVEKPYDYSLLLGNIKKLLN